MTQLPIVFIPTVAVTAQSTDGAVSNHTQKSDDKWKHHKEVNLFIMDVRYGMLAHMEHISLHLEKVLNFSLSVLHIPASNLQETVTVGYDYE